MKKLLIPFLIIILLSQLIHSNNLNWKIGDYWKYEVTMWRFYPSGGHPQGFMKAIMEYKVSGKENVTFHGKSYYTYKVEGKICVSNHTQNFTEFYRVNDSSYIGGHPWYRGGSLIYEPPIERFKFLEVGKKWNQSITEFFNNSFGVQNATLFLYYECIGKENVKTKAGDFECYIIREMYGNNSYSYYLYYFSPEVKNIVLSKYYLNGTIGEKMELIFTSYLKNSLIEMIFITLIILSALFLTIYCFWQKFNIKTKK